MRCLHCKEAKPIRARGLCYGCWVKHGSKYPIRMNRSGSHVLPQCMACEKVAPSNFLAKLGWHSREEKLPSVTVRVVYCPGCFALYGWGDEVSSVAPYSAFQDVEDEIQERTPRVHKLHGGRERSRSMGLRM